MVYHIPVRNRADAGLICYLLCEITNTWIIHTRFKIVFWHFNKAMLYAYTHITWVCNVCTAGRKSIRIIISQVNHYVRIIRERAYGIIFRFRWIQTSQSKTLYTEKTWL